MFIHVHAVLGYMYSKIYIYRKVTVATLIEKCSYVLQTLQWFMLEVTQCLPLGYQLTLVSLAVLVDPLH